MAASGDGDRMGNFIQNLEASLHKGFIDEKYHQTGSYKPKLLVNDTTKNENVLNSLLEELENCRSFIFRWPLLQRVDWQC